MKKILLAVIVITLISCGEPELNKGENSLVNTSNAVNIKNIVNNHDIVDIDGCEYIIYAEEQGYSGFGFMTHKGNCKNIIHNH